MKMKLTMLGTGNALVAECYNTCFLIEDNGRLFMTDGGGGNTILRQIRHAGYDWKDIRHIFVTHKHIDHLMGIIWIVRMICQFMDHGEYEGEAYIYSHREVLDLIRDMSEKLLRKRYSAFLDHRLHLVELSDGETLKSVVRPQGRYKLVTSVMSTLTFFDIQSTKARQYGFRMEIGDGKMLTCCGDEPLKASVEKYAVGSEWMLHEAFCLHAQADIFKPYEKHHSTVKDACEHAERLGVKNLLLYHTEEMNLANRKEMYFDEGSKYYQGALWIPDDLESICL